MEAWLYDEDRWPSGAAGGLVTKDPQATACAPLVMERPGQAQRTVKWDQDDAWPPSRPRSTGTEAARRPPRAPGQHDRSSSADGRDRSWSSASQLDSAQRLVQRLHLPRHPEPRGRARVHPGHARGLPQAVRQDFGKAVPGIFTDEPNYGVRARPLRPDQPCVPWTDSCPRSSASATATTCCDHLLELFFDVDGQQVSPARYHYHDCVTHLFVDAFARQIGEWCDKQQACSSPATC